MLNSQNKFEKQLAQDEHEIEMIQSRGQSMEHSVFGSQRRLEELQKQMDELGVILRGREQELAMFQMEANQERMIVKNLKREEGYRRSRVD